MLDTAVITPTEIDQPPEKLPEEPGREKSTGLGTFNGVFRPTVLTILGVMMYLREGWLVGHAGLGGAVLVIFVTFVITGSTALSLSTITTNIRLGAGGAFAIISQSLGLETGGAIGIPLFLAQALSGALYIYGFAETWRTISAFEDHPLWAVVLGVFFVAFLTAFASTKLAFRLQGIVMLAVLVSLVSIVLGLSSIAEPTYHNPQLWGDFNAGGFWAIFAVFFPAGTGIMVGASMSGSLKNPRRSIPRGTLAAVATSLVVLLFMAVWYSVLVDPETLRTNSLIVIQKAAWGPLVTAGILASTFTATLSCFVAAPKVLQALGQYGVLPKGAFIAKLSKRGEPRVAMLITGGLVLLALSLGSLNRVAQLITMFFLLTYFTINVVVLVEQRLGMVSFRPSFRIPLAVPVVGTVSCAVAVFVINPTFALVALSLVVVIYAYLVKKQLEQPWETVRSGVFVALADWAAKRIVGTQEANERSWKPNLLVPVQSRAELEGNYRFLYALTQPKGSLQIVGIKHLEEVNRPLDDPNDPEKALAHKDTLTGAPNTAMIRAVDARFRGLEAITTEFQEAGLFATSVLVEADTLQKGVQMSAAVMRGNFFRPNVLFGSVHQYDQETSQALFDVARQNDMGVAFFYRHPEAGLGHERTINVWIRDQSPDWHLGLRLANLDLSLLMAYQICRAWGGEIRLLCACEDPQHVEEAEAYLNQLIEDARLIRYSKTWIHSGDFMEQVKQAPRADLNIFGLATQVDNEFMLTLVRQTEHSCLFVRDSGYESALA
jgi:amino acid transporter